MKLCSRKTIVPLAGLLLLAAMALGLYACTAPHLVERADERPARNSEGILAGAEERDLGPEDSRRAVLLVHGHMGGGSIFGALPERLAEAGWRVRVMRLPGHGTSPLDYAETTAGEMRRAVEEELDALSAEHQHVAVVGHSMGGALSALAAAEDKADALVLAAPYFRVTYHWYYGLRPETWSRILAPVVPWLYKGDRFVQVNRPEAKNDILSYRWVATDSVIEASKLAKAARQPETLERIDCPVLWIHGPGDEAASFSAAEKAFEKMPAEEKERLVLEKSNHHIFHDYEREEAIGRIVEFLGRTAPEAE